MVGDTVSRSQLPYFSARGFHTSVALQTHQPCKSTVLSLHLDYQSRDRLTTKNVYRGSFRAYPVTSQKSMCRRSLEAPISRNTPRLLPVNLTTISQISSILEVGPLRVSQATCSRISCTCAHLHVLLVITLVTRPEAPRAILYGQIQ